MDIKKVGRCSDKRSSQEKDEDKLQKQLLSSMGQETSPKIKSSSASCRRVKLLRTLAKKSTVFIVSPWLWLPGLPFAAATTDFRQISSTVSMDWRRTGLCTLRSVQGGRYMSLSDGGVSTLGFFGLTGLLEQEFEVSQRFLMVVHDVLVLVLLLDDPREGDPSRLRRRSGGVEGANCDLWPLGVSQTSSKVAVWKSSVNEVAPMVLFEECECKQLFGRGAQHSGTVGLWERRGRKESSFEAVKYLWHIPKGFGTWRDCREEGVKKRGEGGRSPKR